ncbi:MAG: S8 family peptidase [Armatimonadota bacterium]
MKRSTFLTGSALIAGTTCIVFGLGRATAIQADPPAPIFAAGQFVPGELLVSFDADAQPWHRAAALERIGGSVAEEIRTPSMRASGQPGIVVMRTGLAVADAVRAVRGMAGVRFAEPNWIYRHQATSNDPYYTNGSLWGMYGSATSPANQYGVGAGTAWANNKLGTATVWVGIIDEGAMWSHADLSANFGINPGEAGALATNGKDDDGNGFIDDARGWDFDGNNNSTYDGSTDDHATHVAGTIGAVGGNGIGVAGVNWNVKMLSAKFLGRNGGTTANAIKAIDYFTDLKTRHSLNLVATNNSWGGGGFSQGLQDAIERANTAGILFVAAAGNGGSDGIGDNNDTVLSYPSGYTSANIIAVAAITSSGARSSFSNYGATTVDIGAPGSGIYSTLPTKSNGSTYGSYSGTSMATPHVSGAVALYASLNPGATAAQIKSALLSSATPTASLSGKCVTGGRLNVSGF